MRRSRAVHVCIGVCTASNGFVFRTQLLTWLCGTGNATTQIYGGMTEAGKMVRSAGSQLTGAFKGLWSKTGRGAGSQTTGEPAGMPGAPTPPEAHHTTAP